jgi:hypothetical protein
LSFAEFNQALLQLLIQLQTSKEEQSGLDPTEWVVTEATDINKIRENKTFRFAYFIQSSGRGLCNRLSLKTFRLSIEQKIASSVVPMMMGIFCIADCGENLSLLTEERDRADFQWRKRLWMELFRDKTFMDLSPSSPFGQHVLKNSNEAKANSRLWSRLQFRCRFPFSYVIVEKMRILVDNLGEVAESGNEGGTLLIIAEPYWLGTLSNAHWLLQTWRRLSSGWIRAFARRTRMREEDGAPSWWKCSSL